MQPANPERPSEEKLHANAVGWLTVVALVIATNGPLTTLVSWVPLGIAFGNGIGLPGTFIVVGLLYVLFAVGFTTMSRHVTNAGAFYAYVSMGLGRPLGTAAAFAAILGYLACTLICYAAVGFFLSLAFESRAHTLVTWWACSLAIAAVVHYFAYRDIQFNGKVLLTLMLAEIVMILSFDLTALRSALHRDLLTWAPLLPQNTFVAGFGPSLVFVVSAYMGFETTAIYSEEVRNPVRAIPLATYSAVVVIAVLYAMSAALLIIASGTQDVVARALTNPGTLWFDTTERLMGSVFTDITGVLLFTSLLGALISFNNATVRYWFALGRDGLIWHTLARIHPVQRSAHVAAWLQSAVVAASLLACAWSGAAPMNSIAPRLGVIASVGITLVQILTSLAVVWFFKRERLHPWAWRTFFAPLLSALTLGYLLFEMVTHVDLLVGTSGAAVTLLAWYSPMAAVLGLGFALYLKVRKPSTYQRLNRLLEQK